MKRIISLISISMILTIHLSAQNFSTINFVNSFSRNLNFQIFLNEQLVGSLNKRENLEYKIYSEGRISVTIIAGTERITSSIDIKHDSTYYFLLAFNIFKMVDEETGKTAFSENSNTLKGEEDKRNPIVRGYVIKDSEGPKQGTCFLINQKGYLLTNYHVVNGAKSIQILGIGNDFSTLYGVDIVAFDSDLDLALLKLKNPNVVFDSITYSFSNVSNPQGAKTFVLGYPLAKEMGDEIKVTEGIISAKSGYQGTLSQYQFSAQVQPGNSGSPLFNENGEIIGIINAKLQGGEGVGYAIKSNYILTFLNLVENVSVTNHQTRLSKLTLSEKISVLKNFIFIVKAE